MVTIREKKNLETLCTKLLKEMEKLYFAAMNFSGENDNNEGFNRFSSGKWKAENLVDEWRDLDLIVITNQVYGKHDTEYIVPEPYYNGKSAKIINLGVENF